MFPVLLPGRALPGNGRGGPTSILLSESKETMQKATPGSILFNLKVDEFVQLRLLPLKADGDNVRTCQLRVEKFSVSLAHGSTEQVEYTLVKAQPGEDKWELWRKAVMKVTRKCGKIAVIEDGYPEEEFQAALGGIPGRLRPYVRKLLAKPYLEILVTYCIDFDAASLKKGDRHLVDSGFPEEKKEALQDIQEYVVEAVDDQFVTQRVTQDTRYAPPGYKAVQTDDQSTTVYMQSKGMKGTQVFERASGYIFFADVFIEIMSTNEVKDEMGPLGRTEGYLKSRMRAERIK